MNEDKENKIPDEEEEGDDVSHEDLWDDDDEVTYPWDEIDEDEPEPTT